MSEKNSFSVNPPDLRGERGPLAWFARQIQNLDPELRAKNRSTVVFPTKAPQPPASK